jgi:hypothetical protein
MRLRAREGDLIETVGNVIFDVKGLVHPPGKVIAFPRFIPDQKGSRQRENFYYRKIYSISERFAFLEQNLPRYIVYDVVFDERLCEVPLDNVKKHYLPVECLKELRNSKSLDALEADALEFMETLRDFAGVSWSAMGISGSLLVKLHIPDSDIDPVVYGSENCLKVYDALKGLLQDRMSDVKAYSLEELRKLFEFRVRDTRISFEDFVRTESRKVLQGKFRGRDYFIRFVKDWSEIETEYGAIRYKNVGYARVEAEIEDDSEAVFTPCSYKIGNVRVLQGPSFPIEEIASFRGRFCEQAREGEKVVAQGKVERVMDLEHNREYFRLLLGGKPSDFMVLA